MTAVVKISTAKHGIALTKPTSAVNDCRRLPTELKHGMALTKPTGAVNNCRRLPTQPSAEALQTRRLHLRGTIRPHTRLLKAAYTPPP
jgi:hypothetical protein